MLQSRIVIKQRSTKDVFWSIQDFVLFFVWETSQPMFGINLNCQHVSSETTDSMTIVCT
jgi:hypothetical protein